MNDQQPISPRRRQQELLSIPERQRTDAEWDELNELEIVLASVNRVEAREPNAREQNVRDPNARRNGPPPAAQARPNGGSQQAKPNGGGAQVKKPARKFHKRPPKAPAP
jgi:hypothetical protein